MIGYIRDDEENQKVWDDFRKQNYNHQSALRQKEDWCLTEEEIDLNKRIFAAFSTCLKRNMIEKAVDIS